LQKSVGVASSFDLRSPWLAEPVYPLIRVSNCGDADAGRSYVLKPSSVGGRIEEQDLASSQRIGRRIEEQAHERERIRIRCGEKFLQKSAVWLPSSIF
jgi:hypothetical protein